MLKQNHFLDNLKKWEFLLTMRLKKELKIILSLKKLSKTNSQNENSNMILENVIKIFKMYKNN